MEAQQGRTSHTSLRVNVVSGSSPLSSLVSRPTVTIAPDASVGDAVARMEAGGVSALLVEGGGGLVTERDIAHNLGHGAPLDTRVESIATRQPVVAPASITVLEACTVMLERHVRHLVVDLGAELAVVSIRDVAAVLLQDADPHIWLAALRVAIEVPSELFLG
jgi:CBS domain-containing protein